MQYSSKRDKKRGMVSEYIVHREYKEFVDLYERLRYVRTGEHTTRMFPIMPPNPFDRRYYDRVDPVRVRIIIRFINEVIEIIMRNAMLRNTDVFRKFLSPPPSFSRTKTQG